MCTTYVHQTNICTAYYTYHEFGNHDMGTIGHREWNIKKNEKNYDNANEKLQNVGAKVARKALHLDAPQPTVGLMWKFSNKMSKNLNVGYLAGYEISNPLPYICN